MAWVIDTCLFIDVAEADPDFGARSAHLLDITRARGLVVCPITYVELAPVFDGILSVQDAFLQDVGASFMELWSPPDTVAAHEGWNRYVQAKRKGALPRRPIADVLIGAFALRFDGLLTRNESDFRTIYPNLRIVSP